MRKWVDSVLQHELPTYHCYQAAAPVVRTAGILVPTCDLGTYIPFLSLFTQSTVLAGIESQLLVFLQIISRLFTATRPDHTTITPRSHLHRSDLQRECHHQLTRPHEKL